MTGPKNCAQEFADYVADFLPLTGDMTMTPMLQYGPPGTNPNTDLENPTTPRTENAPGAVPVPGSTVGQQVKRPASNPQPPAPITGPSLGKAAQDTGLQNDQLAQTDGPRGVAPGE